MRLRDLNPKLVDGILRFDCPLGHGHKLRMPVGGSHWTMSGDFPDTLTLKPSIHAVKIVPKDDEHDEDRDCGWHGFITNGEIITV